MILFAHIAVAIISLVFSGFVSFAPTVFRLRASYALIGFTLASGTYLVVSTHAAIVTACTSGLLYLGIVTIAAVHAKHRLTNQAG